MGGSPPPIDSGGGPIVWLDRRREWWKESERKAYGERGNGHKDVSAGHSSLPPPVGDRTACDDPTASD